jgi:hypothetical protein
MLKNWSKIALASFLVLMVGASIASATTARVRSLANTGDYISDDSAVNRWYSTLPSFGNQVNAEMGQWDGNSLTDTRGLGWIQTCGKWGTYRISLNENALDHPGFWLGNPFYQVHVPGNGGPYNDPLGSGAWDDTPMNRWDLAGGWEIGENIALGVSITDSKWSAEDTGNDAKASNSFRTLGAGFSWTNNDKMVFDASLTVGKAGGSAEYPSGTGTNKVEWDSGTAFDLAARLFYDWKDNVTLVPVAEFASSEYSLKQSDTPALTIPNGSKTTDFMLGLGLNMDVNQDNMLVFGLEYMHRSYEYSNPDTIPAGLDKTTWQYLPTVRLALESQITSWLTTRVGAAKYIGSVETKTNDGEKTKLTPGTPTSLTGGETLPGFDWFLGCGFNVAEWTIDLELASETPFNLGYWLTGYSNYSTSAGPITHIAAVWNY